MRSHVPPRAMLRKNFAVIHVLIFLTASIYAVKGRIVDNVASTLVKNGKGEQCAFTADEPGRYRLSGSAKRQWHQPYCVVYVRGPPRSRIHLTFNSDQLDCNKSMLLVYDGWRIFDWLKRKHYSLQNDVDQRERDLCEENSSKNGIETTVETTRNAGQIFYRLPRGETVDVTVSFIEEDRLCNVVISEKVDGQYKISNGGKAGVCTWYIAGAVLMTLDHVHLWNPNREKCEDSGNFLRVQSSSLSWRPFDVRMDQSFCRKEPVMVDHLLPCKFNRIELHTSEIAEGKEQRVTFSLKQASDVEKEPFSYYCY